MKVLLISLLISVAMFANAQQFINFTSGKTTTESSVYELPKRNISSTNLAEFKAQFNIVGGKIAQKSHNKDNYQFIQIKGFGKINTPGHPALPMTIEHILMPKGAKPTIKITDNKFSEMDGFMIHPALEPAQDTYNAEPPEWKKDEAIYSKDAWYPENPVSIHTIQDRRGFPIALVQINPVQFNPVTGKIRVYEFLEYNLEFNGNSRSINELSTNHTNHFTQLLRNEVINKNIIPTGKNSYSKSDGKNYIIITHEAYRAAADTLAKWKRQMGYSVEIVSQTAWTSDQVKEAIHSRYDSWTIKPDYFVIIGDHTGDYAVPGETFQAPNGDGTYASDLYYACMGGYADYKADMAFGRISVNNTEQAMTVVLKNINYERNPISNSDFYSDAIACAQFQDVADNEAPDGYAARRFCHTSEDIRNYTIGQGYNTNRIYYTDGANDPTNYNNGYYSDGQAIPSELLRENGFAWNGNASHIQNAIEDGKFLVFHRDHGFAGGTGWSHPYFSSSNAAALNNGSLLPVVFSINCHTGEYSLGNCFAESFIRNPNGGAVGVVAAAYYSYSGYNDGFSAGMIDAIWSDPGLTPNFGYGGVYNPPSSSANNIRTMGDVMNQGLVRMEQTWGSSTYSHRLFHYFGDPSLRIWTENPNENLITVSHNTTISCDESIFSVTDCNIEDAKVTIIQGDELVGTGFISEGSADIEYAFTQYNSVATLTITAENHKPYVTTIDLTGNCAFPPIVTTGDATLEEGNIILATGNIIDNQFGTNSISGICYSLEENPIPGNDNSLIVQSVPTVNEGTIEVQIENLAASTRYFYKAFATNEYGTGEGEIKYFNTACGAVNEYPVSIDFRGNLIPACWEASVFSGNQGWRFDNPGAHEFQSSTASNGFAALDSEFYGNGGIQNADLISTTYDFAAYGQVSLSFEHYFRSANSGDTATLYYSIDGGENWSFLQEWYSTTGSLASPNNYNIDLSSELSGESNVKFKWNYEGGSDYYWLIDDIQINASQFSRPLITNNDIEIENEGHFYDYTSVDPGNTITFDFKLYNLGDLDLNIDNIEITNSEFSITAQPSTLVESADSTTFSVTYNPTDAGSDELIVTINSDATMHGSYIFTMYVNLESTYNATLELVNSYGDPIENATIVLSEYGTLQTDASGNATFENITVQEITGYNITHADYLEQSGNFMVTHQDITITNELIGAPVNLTFNVSNGDDPLNNATITLEDGNYAITSGGSATVEVNGMQNMAFEISRSGYEDYTGNVNVLATDQSVDIVMIIEGNQVTVNVTSGGTPVENANVTINDVYTAQTNASGVAIIDGIPSGYNRSLDVTAEGYHPYNTNVNILTDVEVDVNLQPAVLYDLTILVMHNDAPLEGATVDIDGTYNGETNSSGQIAFTEIPNGNRSISVTKAGFEPIYGTVNLDSDTTITYQISETGISSNHNSQFRIYPNPTNAGFNIETISGSKSTLRIFNSTGKLVYENDFATKQKYFNIALDNGLYFVRILNEKGQSIQKLIIE